MPSIELFVLVALLAFLAEYIDSSLGMGYGTTLSPLLLLLGFSPLDVVPVVLLSECITGIVAAAFHHTHRNVNFRRDSLDSQVALVLVLIGIVGAIFAVTLALRLPDLWVRLYIGLLVLGMGILMLLKRTYSDGFSWKRLIAVGFLSSFNKGLTGGGYGPLITTGFRAVSSSHRAEITLSASEVLNRAFGHRYWAAHTGACALLRALTLRPLIDGTPGNLFRFGSHQGPPPCAIGERSLSFSFAKKTLLRVINFPHFGLKTPE